eukprot:2033708-Rhodomonas_salina.1
MNSRVERGRIVACVARVVRPRLTGEGGDWLEGVAAVDKVWERVSEGGEGESGGKMPGYEECFQGF